MQCSGQVRDTLFPSAIGLLRRFRDSARIVETASLVASEICTDGSGKQQKAQGHRLASMKRRNLKFG